MTACIDHRMYVNKSVQFLSKHFLVKRFIPSITIMYNYLYMWYLLKVNGVKAK